MSETAVRAAFDVQADWARALGAPFTHRLIESIAAVIDRSTDVGAQVLDWPGDPVADALVLRLLGGLNALVRAEALPDLAAAYPPNPLPEDEILKSRVAAALADVRLLPWLDSAPQTNEIGRSGVLMPGLMVIAAVTRLPLRLFELGASAGLNLRLDKYGYVFGAIKAGAPGATIVLKPDWVGPPPSDATVTVVERRGVDIAPLDACRDADKLLAYVWPEQSERVARLSTALAAFAADPAIVDDGDAADWVEARVGIAEGVTTVVLHSIAYQYFPVAAQARIAAHLAKAGASATPTAPLAWLRFEMEAAGSALAVPSLRLRLWPGGEDRLLARAHPHGSQVTWLG